MEIYSKLSKMIYLNNIPYFKINKLVFAIQLNLIEMKI